jgi:zinc protease
LKARAARITAISLVLLVLLAGLPAFAEKSQVRENVLPNGLKVITKEVHAAPVVSFMVWYKVGSRNEQLGKTGLSHLLEHMQFKGTKTLKKGEIDRLVRKNGGMSNAATWKDFTFYWETLSSDKLELAMRIESDRMVNSLLDPKEFKAEMTVVRSELEGDENDPESLIYYELYAHAFKAHPYQWPTIGWRHDVETVMRDDLYRYYKTFYQPNNAIVVIVGDFDTQKALALVKKYFGKIPSGPRVPKVTASEPEQLGERRAEVRKAGTASRVMMGYHTPAVGSRDIYPLDVLEIVLSTGTSSRLYKALVDKQLATQAWAGASINKAPDLFLLGATARDGVKIEDVETALLAEVERIKSEPITDEELQKALNQLEAQFVYTNDSVSSQSRQLGYYETIFTWKFLDTYLDNARKVTKADVQRVARKYLTQKNRTVVTFIPEAPPAKPQASLAPVWERLAAYGPSSTFNIQGSKFKVQSSRFNVQGSTLAQHPQSSTRNPQSAIRNRVEAIKPTRAVLDNGMVVIVYENRSNPTIAIQGSVNAGSMLDPEGKSGTASITADLLKKGTSRRTADQIASEMDYVGMTLSTGAETESASFSGRSLSKHFDLLLDILSDVMRNPTFPEEEFQKLKARRLSAIKEEQDSPAALGARAFYGSVFPKGHPYNVLSVEEELANTEAISRDDVLAFYKSRYGPESTILVVVGDVDTTQALEQIKKYFGDWKPTGSPKRSEIPDVPLQAGIEKKVVPMPDKSQVDVYLGYSGGLKRSDPDFYAATVMNFVLGGGGALGSRLGDVIRDEMGLVYDVYSTFEATLGAGPWYAKLGTNPQNVDKGIKALVDQMKLMREKGAKQAEMDEAVAYITGSFPVRLERNGSIAGILHAAEFFGLGMDYIQKYQKLYRSVTLQQVNAAAKKYLHPDRYTLVIAGSYENR